MAVNLYESAQRPVVNLEDQVTVYVPGYSYYGPEEPTLCSSQSEFEGIFGSTPYLFEADQTVSKISEGSPEKGYLMAKSLLASGLQVLFHRFKTPGTPTAQGIITITSTKAPEGTYKLVARAISFGKAYVGLKVALSKNQGNLYAIMISSSTGEQLYSGTVSMDPSNSLYIKLANLTYIKFMAEDSSANLVDIEDSIMMSICQGPAYTVSADPVALDFSEEEKGEAPEYQFYLDDDGETKGMLSSLADSSSAGMMYKLGDFEKYPSITYLTSGGYYTNVSVAGNMVTVADKIKAIALIDLNLSIKDQATWASAKTTLATIPGADSAKAKAAFFVGCNSFDLSPYRIILGDSYCYLKCLGENIGSGIADWIPVANDPNGVSPDGYDTTQEIDTELSETIGEGKIGINANPIIYSSSAGGYKIMGNRTLVSNDGVLGPESFLNVSVVVNKVCRAARQVANKLKIVSTSPTDTFTKFKNGIAPTLDPMVTTGDGLQSYKVKHLAKTEAATINIQIALVVVEGIETFNIYIPYSIALD